MACDDDHFEDLSDIYLCNFVNYLNHGNIDDLFDQSYDDLVDDTLEWYNIHASEADV